MNRENRQGEDKERQRIDRALAALEDAVSRCRKEDVRYGLGVSAALSFLALHADGHLSSFKMHWRTPGWITTKPEARWQLLNASLNGIKRVIRR